MTKLELRGLSGTNPLGAMAAFGLLRVLSLYETTREAALAWKFSDDWYAELHIDAFSTIDDLVDWCLQRQRGRQEASFLNWNADLKVAPDQFREVLQDAVADLERAQDPMDPTVRERCDFLVAFASEAVLARSTGDTKPTAFHMTAGQQRFLKSAQELAQSIAADARHSKRQTAEAREEECRTAVREALLGPWKYQDKLHALGWDPTTEGLHALSDISPSEAKPRSVRAAVWLAFESLPLFPCVPQVRGRSGGECRLVTAGFTADGSQSTWPIWEVPLRIFSFRSLLHHPAIGNGPADANELTERGVAAVYCSRCVRDANGRATFRNATRLH